MSVYTDSATCDMSTGVQPVGGGGGAKSPLDPGSVPQEMPEFDMSTPWASTGYAP